MTLAALAAVAVAVAGCGSSSSGGNDNPTVHQGSASGSPGAAACTPNAMKTVSAGNITIGVDQPVYPPWFNDNKNPINGSGFESAVDLAIAKQLGYTPAQIRVKRVTFNQAIQPGVSGFDYDLDEFTITPRRAQVVNFSAPYYNVAEAVVAMKGTRAASVTTFAGLKSLTLGAQTGSTDADTIQNVIKPAHSSLFARNGLAVQALKNHQIDGLVVDLPTAFYVTSAQVSGSTIVGQLKPGANPPQFGALLPKSSQLSSCVSKAITALRASGELASIQKKWLSTEGNAPVLQ
jgi:polar amino acid transport system substrate-binding protein